MNPAGAANRLNVMKFVQSLDLVVVSSCATTSALVDEHDNAEMVGNPPFSSKDCGKWSKRARRPHSTRLRPLALAR